MKRSKLLQLSMALLVTAFSAAAFPADPAVSARGPVPFSSFDADGDDYINEDEFNRVRAERRQMRKDEGRRLRNMDNAPGFSDIDGDGDGRISRQELDTHQQNQWQKRQQQRQGMGRGMGMGGPPQ
jgi:hypothetical protein